MRLTVGSFTANVWARGFFDDETFSLVFTRYSFHHFADPLYFSGTPTVALARGSVFSALEVVPLLVGFDAMEDLRRSRTSPWVQRYKWPIYFFISVAFWNMVGAVALVVFVAGLRTGHSFRRRD